MEIGQKVKVCRVRDRISADLVARLKQQSIGEVQGYKVVDGSGVGVVVKFGDSFSTWFFEDELEPASSTK
ncbi:MAG: DUF2862 domain-containing protein [Cyanobacteria bacterium P01_H01_bin.121]